jgi:hypothetical protein
MRTLRPNLWYLSESPVETHKPTEINLLKMLFLLTGDFTTELPKREQEFFSVL